ncbi:hypothetical protein WICPIJ_004600 [Wickerhamomyces pijperi]|uniref:Homeobox domain-containing protein n=1 Tax=Wickerhamomyces pijperi TaxID=599730 RepID=A0A9P8Q7N9_WICPI|nr:hypothetical protein WICPIJ_004600 [Wickerhamomyces pijperi]
MTDPNEQHRTKDPVSDDVSSAKEEETGAQLESPAEIVTQQQQQQAAEDEQVTLLLQQQPISTTIHKEGTFKLPPISNILSSIDQFQSSKQLEDSKLLLELCASNSEAELRPADSESSSVHQPAPTSTHPASLIASPAYSAFSPQDNNNSFPPQHLRSESTSSVLTDELETRSPSPIRSPSSFTSGLDSVSTTRQNSNVSLKNERDSSEESLDPSSDSGYSQGNKKRTNLPRETIKILNEWILRNIDNPYPNHSQKRILLDRTGLSNVQLSNWFINKRRRRIFSNLSGNNGQPIKKKRLIDRI